MDDEPYSNVNLTFPYFYRGKVGTREMRHRYKDGVFMNRQSRSFRWDLSVSSNNSLTFYQGTFSRVSALRFLVPQDSVRKLSLETRATIYGEL